MGEVFPTTDVPILSHLTYEEAHKFLRGAWVGFAIALALTLDRRAFAFALLERVHKRQQNKHQQRETDNRLKGLRADAWYVFSGIILSFLVTYGVVTVAL